MDAATLGLLLIIVVALAFDYTNGFHDSANAIATSVSTKALTPRAALVLAAVMNVVGALVSTKVAATVGAGIIATPTGTDGLVVVFSALLGAIAWNLLTWYFGLPSSSSHALIGGLVGAALAPRRPCSGPAWWTRSSCRWCSRRWSASGWRTWRWSGCCGRSGGRSRHRANRDFRHAQIGSAALMAFGHGTQDAQKTMGVITLALVTSGHLASFHVPLWVVLASAAAISAGTYAGGWRIMRTMGRRIIHLTPADGRHRADGRQLGDAEHRVRLRGAGLDHARDHLVGDGRRRDPAAVRGALGRGPLDRRGLGVHDPGRRRGGRAGLPAQLDAS